MRKLDLSGARTYKPWVAADRLHASFVQARLVVRWVLGRALRRPGTWLLLGFASALVGVGRHVSPLGDVGVEVPWALADAWAVPLGALGAALTLHVLGRAEAFLRLVSPGPRLVGEGASLFLGALGLQLPLALTAWWSSAQAPGPALLGWIGAALQAAALGLVLLRWPALAAVRLSVFVGAVWLVPTLAPGGGGRLGRALLDLEGTRRSLTDSPSAALAWFSVVGALFLASALLACSPGPRGEGAR